MAETSGRSQPRKRRWWRFSIRSLVLLVLGLNVALAFLGGEISRARRQHEAVVALTSMNGAVWYDDENNPRKESKYRRWARELVHEDCFTHVTRVELNGGTQGISTIKHLLRVLEMQEKLGISEMRAEYTHDAIGHLLALSELKQLSLWSIPVSDVELERLVSLTELESLNLSGTKITDSGLQYLRKLPKLRRLDLSGTAVTDEGMNALSELAQLEELVLGATAITDRGVARLATMQQLRRLYLRDTAVTDTGLKSLRALPRLEMLDLIETKVTDEALESLQDFKRLQTVKVVEEIPSCLGSALTSTLVTEEAIEKLHSQRPRLQIEYTKPRTWISIPVP